MFIIVSLLIRKEHGGFFAELVVRSGAVFVSVDYDLCPHGMPKPR